jgi:hypothetical protein
VDEVAADCGRVEKRQRQLPARVVVYFVLAVCLFSGQGYEEVARLRLGPEPLRAFFARVCRPVATVSTWGAWYRDLRLIVVDGTTFDLPDTAGNAAFFGRPGSGRGQGRGA